MGTASEGTVLSPPLTFKAEVPVLCLFTVCLHVHIRIG